ncbi:hypothetical protein QBC32DRAFT_127303 [Pseudoneurospora amorphoporcata]|uniref:Uncharacterized protein n=1 Tax=Pseudoneurospora amorphoporcata TaxID=241081 RepID=A0AAN6NKC9_9PEZI|nr:hypothetical protein QBC32DRAFT_127303 [Pseudoneurospora amorphoporcata]
MDLSQPSSRFPRSSPFPSAQAFSCRSELRDTPLDNAESLDLYGDTQDGRRSLPRYDFEPLHPPPTARSPRSVLFQYMGACQV